MKYYCRDQFRTLHIRSTNSGSVLVGSCCASLTEPVTAATFDFGTNEFLSIQRQAAVADKPAPACINCWRQEAQNPPSRRFFSNKGHDQDIKVELNRVDITTQNVCNLACIMCSSYSSSLWAKQEGLTDQDYSFEDKLSLFQRLDHANIYQMHFTGGEPLMSTEHLRMLNIYSQSAPLSQLHISYNTNGTFFPDQKVIDIWQQARMIDLVISLDGTGSAAELIRWPCEWSHVAENVKKFFALKSAMPNMKLSFIGCASNYNLWELADVVDFLHQFDDHPEVHFQVNHRPFFAPALIPDHMVEPVSDRLGQYGYFDNLIPTLKHQFADQDRYERWYGFLKFMRELDRARSTNWMTALKIGEYMPCFLERYPVKF
jgi:pyruvate-formate lyase-activating enzyme